ncbi:hypothetical protein DMENIID0001_014540 [Sergentomyia squamirostris]
MELRSRVVYEIPCKDCNKVYIGTTNQHLKTRIRQHERDCKPPIKNENSTALCKHSVKSHHKFGFSDTKIIATHNNYHKQTHAYGSNVDKEKHCEVCKQTI